MKKKNILLFVFCCLGLSVSAQQGNIWYFGYNAGLDFNSGAPVALTDGVIRQWEGVATISDASGNLVFYTDGMKVWDRLHRQMPNGYGLKGDPSATQSGVIVPQPGSPNIYYIFTVDNNIGPGGLQYSIVDMSANGGYGDVLIKNKLLYTPSTEKITAIHHANGQDIWVVTHRWNSSEFYTWRVTSAGFDSIPVISNIGVVHSGASNVTRGYMKASHNGDKIAVAIEGYNAYQLFDFDNSTGRLTNAITLYTAAADAYGVEFSPSGRYLYGSERWGYNIYQFDLQAGSVADIKASRTVVATLPNRGGGALQLAPDGKIYLARAYEYHIGVIEDPDQAGAACNYTDVGADLSGKESREGLPNFISSFFGTSFTQNLGCPGDTSFFSLIDTVGLKSVQWYFNYPSTAPGDMSQEVSPGHVYQPGVYEVRMICNRAGQVDTSAKTIEIEAYPSYHLPTDTVLAGGTVEINLPSGYAYEWADDTIGAGRSISTPGTYTVTASNMMGCKTAKSMNIWEGLSIRYDVNCPGQATSFYIDDEANTTNPVWYFNYPSDDPAKMSTEMQPDYIFSEGIYHVMLVADYGGYPDTVRSTVVVEPYPESGLPATSSIECSGGIDLIANYGYDSYLWSDGTTTAKNTISNTGLYTLTMTDWRGCTTIDTVDVSRYINFSYTINCAGTPSEFFICDSVNYQDPLWYFDYPSTANADTSYSMNPKHVYESGGTYEVWLIADYGGVTDTAVKQVYVNPLAQAGLRSDTSVCSNESIEFAANTGYDSYLWSTGATTSSIEATAAGWYVVSITDHLGCVARDSAQILNSWPLPEIYTTVVDASAQGMSDGEIDVSLAGGNPGYYYAWSDGSTIEDRMALKSGWYILTVVDMNYCMVSKRNSLTAGYSCADTYDWVKAGAQDNGNDEEGMRIATDSEGNVYIMSSFSGTVQVGDEVFTSDGAKDSYIAAYNEQWDPLWAVQLYTEDDPLLYKSLITDNTNLYIAGTFFGDFKIGDSSLTAEGINDIYIIKMNKEEGEIIYTKQGQGSGDDRLAAADLNSAGELLLTGTFTSDTLYLGDTAIVRSTHARNSFAMKMDANGSATWLKPIIHNDGEAFDICTDNSDNIYLYGLYTDTANLDGDALLEESEGGSFYVAKYDDADALLWTKTFETSLGNSTAGIAMGDNQLFLTGDYTGSIDFASDASTFATGVRDAFVISYQQDGSFIWLYNYGENTGQVEVDALAANENDNVFVIASFSDEVSMSDTTFTSLASNDQFFARYDAVGNLQNFLYICDTGTISINDMVYGQDNSVLTTGEFGTDSDFGYDQLSSNGTADMFIGEIGNMTPKASAGLTSSNCFQGGVQIELDIRGSQQEYDILWTDGQTTEAITVWDDGHYSAYVADSLGCMSEVIVSVTIPTGPQAITEVENVSLPGGSDGQIDLEVEQGTSPFSYQWSAGPASQDLANVPEGTYQVTVTDAVHCEVITSAVVTAPDSPLRLYAEPTHVSCGATNDGSVNLVIQGGTPPYNIEWSNGATTDIVVGLTEGPYSVTVTDGTYTNAEYVTITRDVMPLAQLGSDTLFCQPGYKILDVEQTGASYLWNSGSTAASMTASKEGVYSVTVSNTCGMAVDSFTLYVGSIPLSLPADQGICQGDTFSLSINPDFESWQWSDGATSHIRLLSESGLYSISATDACTSQVDSFRLTVNELPQIAGLSGDNIFCDLDSIKISPSGTFSAYLWSTGATTDSVLLYAGGNYALTVTDSNNCKNTTSMTFRFDSTRYHELSYQLCPGDSMPYKGVYYKSDTSLTDSLTADCGCDSLLRFSLSVLQLSHSYIDTSLCANDSFHFGQSYISQPGHYEQTIYSAMGCDSLLLHLNLDTLPVPAVVFPSDTSIAIGNSIELEITGEGGYTYQWSPADAMEGPASASPRLMPEATASYSVTISNAHNCLKTGQVEVEVTPLPPIVPYNTITPNGDGYNDYWVVDNLEEYPWNKLQLFNRTGVLIWEQENYQNDWDGRFNEDGEKVEDGVYFYLLYTEQGGVPHKGYIMVIK